MKLSSEECDVLFHILNNTFGEAFDKAAQRAEALDGITREEFVRRYNQLLFKFANSGFFAPTLLPHEEEVK